MNNREISPFITDGLHREFEDTERKNRATIRLTGSELTSIDMALSNELKSTAEEIEKMKQDGTHTHPDFDILIEHLQAVERSIKLIRQGREGLHGGEY